jgi:hypothetical protein
LIGNANLGPGQTAEITFTAAMGTYATPGNRTVMATVQLVRYPDSVHPQSETHTFELEARLSK